MPNNPMYGSNKFDAKVGQRLYTEAGTSREHENSTDAADLATYTIPADTLSVGDIVRIKVFATVIDSNSTDTLTPILKFGGTAIATGANLAVADDDIVYAWADVHVTKTGSSGTCTAIAELRTDALGATVIIGQTALTSMDTTGGLAVVLNVDWSAAHADNEVRIDTFSVELVQSEVCELITQYKDENMRYALFNVFPSFLVGRCVISFDDIITIEDITDLEEGSATGWL